MDSVLLNAPTQKTDTVVVFIPGMSGGARTHRFQALEDTVLERGYACARVDLWGGGDDLQSKTLRNLRSDFDAVLDTLVSRGFSKILGIGKSFGGGLLLVHSHSALTKKILWAPAFTYSHMSTYQELLDRTLGEIPNLSNLAIAKSDIDKSIPVTIVHGSEDAVVLLENSKKIASETGAVLIEIEGADHSFKEPEHECQLLVTTLSAL